MKLYRFDAEAAQPIDRYGSRIRMARIARPAGDVRLGCMHLGPGGLVGYHQATVPQLFMVVAGEGWVRGAEPARTPIQAGQATFWTAGEWHEAGTGTGLTALVLEAGQLDPAPFMPAL